MLAEERRQKIYELLQQNQRVIAKDLAELFAISIDSIRRDFTIMEDQGLLQKTYGGAVPLPKVRTFPQPEAIRYGEGLPHQNAISKAAASFIQKNDTVYIGGAGIQFGMIKFLPTDIPFTLVTNSLKIAESIRTKDNIECYLIGGKLRPLPSSGTMIDAIALETIRKFTLDLSFITGGGIAPNGISTATPEGAAFTHAVADVSRKRVCLAPHERVGVRMFITSLPIERVDILITDQEAPEQAIQAIKNRRVQVIYADQNKELESDHLEMHSS